MANLASVTENFFTIASETFTDNLSASISAGAATVPVNNASEYAEGDRVVLTVDPGTVNEATFLGVKDTGNQFINCKWTEGNTAVGHDSGATIIDYDSATHHNAQTKGILEFADQQGNLLTQAVRDALNLGSSAVNGWEVLPYTLQVSSGYNKGNDEYEITIANNDLRPLISPGFKLRLERSTAAPTQCLDLEASSSQYTAKTTPSGYSFTDDFTIEANLNMESYPSVLGPVASKYNGTSGFYMSITATGQVVIKGFNAGSSNVRQVSTYVGIPLGEDVHIAAELDMSGSTGAIYINGISVPIVFSQGGTNPSALIQAGDFQIGKDNTTNYFDGKITDVRVWSTLRTATQIRDNMNQQLTGSESGLVAYYKLNGDLLDSTTNANHLTGSGGAAATTLGNSMKTTEYAVVTKVAYSAPNTTLTVFTGTKHSIPNMTLSTPYYSVQDSPYGFPRERNSWDIKVINKADNAGTSGGFKDHSLTMYLPTGAWDLGYEFRAFVTNSVNSPNATIGLSTSNSAFNEPKFCTKMEVGVANVSISGVLSKRNPVEVTSQTPYYTVSNANTASGVITLRDATDATESIITARCAYV